MPVSDGGIRLVHGSLFHPTDAAIPLSQRLSHSNIHSALGLRGFHPLLRRVRRVRGRHRLRRSLPRPRHPRALLHTTLVHFPQLGRIFGL